MSKDLERLPGDLPDTIEDAITVTQKLGFRYLWIDRYCINQKSEEAHTQIRQMDLIYRNSGITIIAIAGETPSYGLPGVGRRNRTYQPRARVGKHLLVSALQDSWITIEGSLWSTRGWTYQEALLFRRRLVFTDQQVYLECYGMYCCEALDFPLQDLHTKSGQRFKAAHCGYDRIGTFPRDGVGKKAADLAVRIMEYSSKSLTYESDVLNGFSGILRPFETGAHTVRHCWGVPSVIGSTLQNMQSAGQPDQSHLRALTAAFCVGLSWQLREPSTGDQGFLVGPGLVGLAMSVG
ncbi:hypothetical protein H2201_003718 [Coniosporium apollinis]|uniref:Heterokaryon incompatibility domain-containing protein n=2 Tax=Coniosporium TaxID=2810619 RepID=A0ABQ9NXJ9_9PEZI|nr:hypothetical protein H2199_005107 [Cladosporium sp. JES 115]KAJ9666040.1 hypothetical protein H2201_003718 [Coniosporium apollinis]